MVFREMDRGFAITGITILFAVIFPTIPNVTAQNEVNLSTYTNPIYGMTLQYPSDWDIIPNVGNASGYNVPAKFIPNSLESSNGFLNFDIQVDLNMNKNLFDYMIETINQESDFLKDYNFNLLYSTFGNVSLAGSPAYQFIYVNTGMHPK